MTEKILIDRAVVEQALEALDEADLLMEHRQNIELRRSALVALRATLEQPQVEQEPCGHMRWKNGSAEYVSSKHFDVPLDEEWHLIYTQPQPPRQPLTDDDITQICVGLWSGGWREKAMQDFARAIEAAHGIKEQK